MQAFKGTVTELRSVAVTASSSSGASNTHHVTTVQFGGQTMNMKTKNPPPIHLGDELRVYGTLVMGAVRPVLLHNPRCGFEYGVASWLNIGVAGVLGAVALFFGLGKHNEFCLVLGLLFAALAIGAGFWRSAAWKAMAAT